MLLPWRDEVAAVLVGYFGGQEFGDAVADVLLGAAEPGGRLPTTWPAQRRGRARALDVTPGRRRARLHEGIHIGYRAWLKHDAAPAYWFGHGLGYTDVAVDRRRRPGAASGGEVATVTVDGRRTPASAPASRSCRSTPSARTPRSTARSAGWSASRPCALAAGESATVDVEVPTRLLAYWDDGWTYEPGAYTLRVGTSVVDLPLRHRRWS